MLSSSKPCLNCLIEKSNETLASFVSGPPPPVLDRRLAPSGWSFTKCSGHRALGYSDPRHGYLAEALEKARKGVYSRLDIERGLPANLVSKYMKPHPEGYKVADSVMRLLRYQELNLLHPFRFQEPFDIIFCRNVAIYFEKRVKIDLFRRMLPILHKDGYLFVGVSESLFDCGPEFKPQSHCRGAFYQPHLTMQSLQTPATPVQGKSNSPFSSSPQSRLPNPSPSGSYSSSSSKTGYTPR